MVRLRVEEICESTANVPTLWNADIATQGVKERMDLCGLPVGIVSEITTDLKKGPSNVGPKMPSRVFPTEGRTLYLNEEDTLDQASWSSPDMVLTDDP